MAFSEVRAADEQDPGYAGFVGAVLLLFAFLSVLWSGLDPSTDLRLWFTLSVELIGGLAIGLAFGFRLARRVPLHREMIGVAVGVLAGLLVVGLEIGLLSLSYYMSTGQGVWLAILAPVAETMAFTVAFYHLFKYHFPELSWIALAIPSDLAFAMFHFFAYGGRPDFWLVLIILEVGNTVLMYVYHLTKNATAPMVGHLLINLGPNANAVTSFLLTWGPVFMLLFAAFLVIYMFFGGRRS